MVSNSLKKLLRGASKDRGTFPASNPVPRAILGVSYVFLKNIIFLKFLMLPRFINSADAGPRRHGLVVRVVACESRGPGFDSSSDQMVFLFSGIGGRKNK